MTDTDAIIIIACVIVLALYAAWLWDEAKNAVPYPPTKDTESQNKGTQAHETTSNEETPSKETKTQQEGQK